MAKKKPVSSEFNTLNIEKPVTISETDMNSVDKLQEKAGIIELSINDEAKQMINASEKLAEENAKYAEIISDLQERMADYIQELTDLRAKVKEMSEAPTPITEIDGVNVMDFINELKREKQELQDQLNKMNSQIHVVQTPKPTPKTPPKLPTQNNYYRRRFSDGYSSWN